MSKLTIEIELANAAFEDDPEEVARILKDLISVHPVGIQAPGHSGRLYDLNGHDVGRWSVTLEDPTVKVVSAPRAREMF
jgi:hypothetical protein